MRDLVKKARLDGRISTDSAATSGEEIGNPVYPPAKRMLSANGIDCTGKRARRITSADYDRFDLLVGMDQANLRSMKLVFGGDPKGKIRLLLSFAGSGRDVADPWYTGDFDAAWRDIDAGCRALLEELKKRL